MNTAPKNAVWVRFRTDTPTSGLLWIDISSDSPGAVFRGSDHRMVFQYSHETALWIVKLIQIGAKKWLENAGVQIGLIEPCDGRHIWLHRSSCGTEIHLEMGGVALQGPTDCCVAFTEPINGWVGSMMDLYASSNSILLDDKNSY